MVSRQVGEDALTHADGPRIARSVISVSEALAQVVAATPVLGTERVTLTDAAGRVAADDVVANRLVPAAANSAMDGFAVRHADLASVPARLRIVAVEPAGTVTDAVVGPGTAVKLFTGSVVPSGADTVVKVEDTEEADGHVVVRAAASRRGNVREAGEDVRPGQVVVAAGTSLGPADLGILASVGRATVVVHRRPRVAIVATGSELVELDETPGPGQVVNTNAYALAAAVREAGGEPVVFPIVRDRPDDLRRYLAEALAADVVLTTGGVSVGELDFVKETLAWLGVEQVFWKVAQKPGKPLAFGRRDGRLVFGLPGNPVSALVCFAVYVRPALRRMQGHRRIHLPVVRARLAQTTRKAKGLVEFLRVSLADGPDGLVATPFREQGSGVLTSLGAGAGLLIGPAELPEIPSGGVHPVVVLASETLASETPPL